MHGRAQRSARAAKGCERQVNGFADGREEPFGLLKFLRLLRDVLHERHVLGRLRGLEAGLRLLHLGQTSGHAGNVSGQNAERGATAAEGKLTAADSGLIQLSAEAGLFVGDGRLLSVEEVDGVIDIFRRRIGREINLVCTSSLGAGQVVGGHDFCSMDGCRSFSTLFCYESSLTAAEERTSGMCCREESLEHLQ